MGKMFKLCAALAIILCASAAAFAENYVEMDRSGTNVIYIDTDSIVDEGSYIIANTKVDIRTKEARDKFKERSGVDAHCLFLTFAYNKDAKQDHFLSARSVYGIDETGSKSREFSEKHWRDIPQHSIGEKVYDWKITYAAEMKLRPASKRNKRTIPCGRAIPGGTRFMFI